MKCLVHHEIGFDRISINSFYVFGFHAQPALRRDPIAIADPDHPILYPGNRLIGIGGKNTSAGFIVLKFIDGNVLIFEGSVHMNDLELLCFRLEKHGIPIDPDVNADYAAAFYGWIRLDSKRWFVSNTACAGRIIQTSKIHLSS